ncbi:MAG TPA: hypothetical protein VK085_12550 [Pseudogracilibacillus sp.]|nr:hypothetical protein [Pseudogracilibacillus sp.]
MLIQIIVPFLAGSIIFFIVGWITGDEAYGGVKTKDDERSQFIKQKAIVSSWVLLLMFLLINFVFGLFKIKRVTPNMAYPELFYLLLFLGGYFVYYWIDNKRWSGNEK